MSLHRSIAFFSLAVCAAAFGPPRVPAATIPGGDTAAPLGEITVTASLRPQPAETLPASVSVLARQTLLDSGVQHFQDVLGQVPNLNWAAGSSRPRFFQIRGIGDLEQYQGAPNPSVAFLIDEIDLSGVGMAATLFDVEQVEVLRGPQGTRYGANALAGLIKVATREPQRDFEIQTQATVGQDDARSLGAVLGGALPGTETGAFRLAVQQYDSDGFRRNAFRGRDDTNQRDELTARARLRLGGPAGWSLDATALLVDLDNGYDAFSIDNSRVTQSDDPGRDSQRTGGGSMRLRYGSRQFEFLATSAYADSKIENSFDGDWGNDAFWGAFAPYDFTSRTLRDRRTFTQDLRLASAALGVEGRSFAWLGGLYYRRLAENNGQLDLFNGEVFRALTSEFAARSTATYGQVEWRVAERLDLAAGLRFERRRADYSDSDGSGFDPNENMLGGHLSASLAIAPSQTAYLTLARGYKNGGFNIGAEIQPERRQFQPEYLWNLEAGLKSRWAGGRIETQAALFYMRRRAQQVETSFQLEPGNPLSYVFYTDNAAAGENYGLESSWRWRMAGQWWLDGSLGLLNTRYLDYQRADRDLSGRDQSYAPAYQYSLGLTWRSPAGFMARADVNGRDAFYYSASHDQRARVSTLVNLKLGYEARHWSVHLWGLNVFDEDYSQLGFFFVNEPPFLTPKRYTQAGDPRQLGVTAQWNF